MADIAGAVNQGIQGFNALAQGLRARESANALAATYGPQAADPEQWQRAVMANAVQQETPSDVSLKQAQAKVATESAPSVVQQNVAKGTEAQNTAQASNTLHAIGVLRGAMKPDGSVDPNVAGDLLGDGSQFGITPQMATALANRLSQPSGGQILDPLERNALAQTGHASLLGMAGSPQFGRDANGNPIAIMTSKMGGQPTIVPLPAGTQTIQQQNAITNANRPHTITDAAGNVYSLTAAAPTAARAVTAGAGAPQLQSIQGPMGTQNKAAATQVGQNLGQSQAERTPGTVANAAAELKQQTDNVRFQANMENIDQAMKLADAGTGTYGALTSWLPGSAASNFKAALNSVHSDIVTNVIQQFKQTSQKGQASGVGRILQSEIKLWQDAYAAVEHSQSAAMAKTNLMRLRVITQRLWQANNQYYQSLGVSGAAPASPAGWSIQRVK